MKVCSFFNVTLRFSVNEKYFFNLNLPRHSNLLQLIINKQRYAFYNQLILLYLFKLINTD